MRNLYTNEKLFEDLFGFRHEFNEMFNRILTGKPWGLELPEFKKTFNITPAVEAYVDKEAKKYVCRVSLPGIEWSQRNCRFMHRPMCSRFAGRGSSHTARKRSNSWKGRSSMACSRGLSRCQKA